MVVREYDRGSRSNLSVVLAIDFVLGVPIMPLGPGTRGRCTLLGREDWLWGQDPGMGWSELLCLLCLLEA